MGKVRYRCCVPKCLASCLKGKKGMESFFRCPDPARLSSPYLRQQAELRLDAWRKVVSENLSSTGRICSRHFVSGRPAKLECASDIDWIPVLLLPNKTCNAVPDETSEATNRAANTSDRLISADNKTENRDNMPDRHKSAAKHGDQTRDASALSSEEIPSCSYIDDGVYDRHTSAEDFQDIDGSCSSSECTLSCVGDDQLPFDEHLLLDGNTSGQDDEDKSKNCKQRKIRNVAVQATPLVRRHFTQTESIGNYDPTKDDKVVQEVERLKKIIERQNMEMDDLKETIRRTKVDMQSLKERPSEIKYYTGLDSYNVVEMIFRSIEPHMIAPLNLTKEQVFLMTLQKLRFNCFLKSLSISYDVCPATTSAYYLSTIYTLYKTFYNVVHWPSKDTLRKHTPQCFRDLFGDETTIIIDCFEIRGERSSNNMAAARQWSDYKKGNTLKYLIGISSTGCVIFVSKGYGGRSSDKHITTVSGFLDKVSEGDVIMADRGFLIESEIKKKNARLNIPAFKKNGAQLTALDVENTRKIATVRIHVERVIGVIREKYQVLKGNVPMTSILRRHNGIMEMDMVVYVAAILVNMCKPIID